MQAGDVLVFQFFGQSVRQILVASQLPPEGKSDEMGYCECIVMADYNVVTGLLIPANIISNPGMGNYILINHHICLQTDTDFCGTLKHARGFIHGLSLQGIKRSQNTSRKLAQTAKEAEKLVGDVMPSGSKLP
ncbi:unnamed protein product [Sphagnum troendelagicum]|uniref:Uncharacterized protein n=1 Tax=Sphagnum troendelagicum TaxID=128251 RepID=A0ABP0V1X7_9BRYO